MTKRITILFLSLIIAAAGLLVVINRPVLAQLPQRPLPQQPRQLPAQRPAPTPSDDQVNRVAKQMYCPVCENIPLDVCPTQACHDWRELIRQKLDQGWSDQQIKDYFAAQYGDRVLNEPPQRGLNWLVYVLPPLGFLIGAVIVWRVLASMRMKTVRSGHQPVNPTAPSASTSDDPYLAKLEEELKKKE